MNQATENAVNAINSLGIDLLTQATAPNENCVLSPYSIQSGLAMTYAGADGGTRAEMAEVLHYMPDEGELHRSFAALQQTLDELAKESAERAKSPTRRPPLPGVSSTVRKGLFSVHTDMTFDDGLSEEEASDTVTFTFANSLFGQQGFDFLAPFLALVKDNYGAPFQALDFKQDRAGARRQMNQWVEDRTHQRIRECLPDGVLTDLTRLVLVGAVHFKAPWGMPFGIFGTRPRPFHVSPDEVVDVPTMTQTRHLGYTRRKDLSIVAIPYGHSDLQFLILLPDSLNGLTELEHSLTSDLLNRCARLEEREVVLYLPRFTLEPPILRLDSPLRGLGMKSAFDEPRGSANFSRIAPRRPNDYLYLQNVFHKAFLSVDEAGTEATAATAVISAVMCIDLAKPQPIEVRVDHPFLFAIQHCPTGACLFLGRVTDPR